MSIWEYSDSSVYLRKDLQGLMYAKLCLFCRERLRPMPRKEVVDEGEQAGVATTTDVSVCPICGWWVASRRELTYPVGDTVGGWYKDFCAAPGLRRLDLTDVSVPIEEVRSYLVARYDSRFDLNATLFEQTVTSVFGSLGYDTLVTGRSGDGGIDAVLDDGKSLIGVQVKRYRDTIEVEQIRALAGALMLRGYTKGVFVTTSSYQRGAASTAARYAQRGYAIELYDAPRFLTALKLAQRTMYRSFEEFAAAQRLDQMQLIVSDGVY